VVKLDRRITFVSPERDDQIARRAAEGAHGGRAPVFDAEVYKQRNVVERCFNRLMQFRDLATRYAKGAAYYQAELTIAAIALASMTHSAAPRREAAGVPRTRGVFLLAGALLTLGSGPSASNIVVIRMTSMLPFMPRRPLDL
jgi:hypothetical protein